MVVVVAGMEAAIQRLATFGIAPFDITALPADSEEPIGGNRTKESQIAAAKSRDTQREPIQPVREPSVHGEWATVFNTQNL
jgi:hypothetical protein